MTICLDSVVPYIVQLLILLWLLTVESDVHMPSDCTVVIISTSSLQLLRGIVSFPPIMSTRCLEYSDCVRCGHSISPLIVYFIVLQIKSHPLQTVYFAVALGNRVFSFICHWHSTGQSSQRHCCEHTGRLFLFCCSPVLWWRQVSVKMWAQQFLILHCLVSHLSISFSCMHCCCHSKDLD